jgi:hypothetical protein
VSVLESNGLVHPVIPKNVERVHSNSIEGTANASIMDAILCGRAVLEQRVGGVQRAATDDWVAVSPADAASVSVESEGLRFLVYDVVPQLLEVRVSRPVCSARASCRSCV